MISLKNGFALALVLAAPGSLCAQGVSFDALANSVPAGSAAAFTAPEVPALKAAPAAPELAYEKIVIAPVWKNSAAAAGSSALKEGFSPARYQGQRNMCNVFAALGLAEYLVWQKEGNIPDFSEEFLYYNAKLNFTDKPELQAYKKEQGLVGYVAVDALRGGVAAEKEWPFQAALPAHTPVPPLTDPDMGIPPAGIAGKVLGYRFSPVAVRRSEIKDFIAKERRPVVMNLMLYTGNIDNASGRLTDPTESQRQQCFSAGDNCGGHVVLLTGFDAASGEYVFRNSWGASWGNAGFGRLSEKYLLENCEACQHISRLGTLDQSWRAMVVNSVYGWSAELK